MQSQSGEASWGFMKLNPGLKLKRRVWKLAGQEFEEEGIPEKNVDPARQIESGSTCEIKRGKDRNHNMVGVSSGISLK